MADPDEMVFRGIKVEFLSEGLEDYKSPMYSIVYEYMGFTHQGYFSSNILTICRYLVAYFDMTDDEIFTALKPVADEINKVCNDIEKKGDKK